VIVWSTNPGGSRFWHTTQLRGSIQLEYPEALTTSLVCWTGSTPKAQNAACVAGVGNTLISSRRATGRATAWRADSVGGFSALKSMSCPSVSLCVAIDDQGHILTTADPASRSWNSFHVAGIPEESGNGNPAGMVNQAVIGEGVACGSVSLCVIVVAGIQGSQRTGFVLSSTNPAGGAGAWQVSALPPLTDSTSQVAGPISVSCPSAAFCVGVGPGVIITSTNPTGGAGAWQVSQSQPATASPLLELENVSCPSTSFCVAGGDYYPSASVDDAGVFVSTQPAGGAATWQLVSQAAPGTRLTVACGSATQCAAVGLLVSPGQPVAASSNNPTGGGTAWTGGQLPSNFGPASLSCTADGLCASVGTAGGFGLVATAVVDANGSLGSWTPKFLGPTVGSMTAVSCPVSSLCVAGDILGNVVVGSG
jgi:hypothetical protein